MPHHRIFAGDFFADWVRRRLSPAFMSAVRRAGNVYPAASEAQPEKVFIGFTSLSSLTAIGSLVTPIARRRTLSQWAGCLSTEPTIDVNRRDLNPSFPKA